jgi:hypothetical protein
VKVSLLRCVCFIAICTQLAGCGEQDTSAELDVARASGAPFESGGAAGATPTKGGEGALGSGATRDDAEAEGDDAKEGEAAASCPDPCIERTPCGQICLTMKGPGSSCQLVPTANDLTRPPRSVQFNCDELQRGPNGYDFDALGHITLTGSTCEALHRGGPHRVALLLSCPPT